MKKKLVAFAVTAAMVVTSAVPVFAADWTGKDITEKGNVVTVASTANGVKDTTVKADLTAEGASVTHSAIVDFNKAPAGSGEGIKIVPVFKLDTEVEQDSPVYLEAKAIDSGAKSGYNVVLTGGTLPKDGVETVKVKGIVSFNWTITKNRIDVTVTEYGEPEEVTLSKEFSVANLKSIEAIDLEGIGGMGGQIVGGLTMYNEYPENVESIEVVTDFDTKDEAPATQPVEGETLTVKSVTLSHDTPVDMDIYSKYVTIEWLRDGVVFDTNHRSYKPVPADRGHVISVRVKGVTGSGVFNAVVWGEDTDPIAVATRYAGATRYETAMEVASAMDKEKGGKGFQNFVVTTGEGYADALSATALADKLGAPILLVNEHYEDAVVEYIAAHDKGYASDIYIVGGTGVVSENFEKALAKYHKVERVAGNDRFATNLAVLEMVIDKASDNTRYTVASGYDYADALSAAATGRPVILVGDSLTEAQWKFLEGMHVTADSDNFYIIGGTAAVSAKVESQLKDEDFVGNAAGKPVVSRVVRIEGENRFETNELVVKKFFDGKMKNLYIASGDDYADALTGAIIALQNDAPLVLVNDYNTFRSENLLDTNLFVIGGTGAVSNEVVQTIYAQKIV